MAISLHSTSLTAVTFCILPNTFEWVLGKSFWSLLSYPSHQRVHVLPQEGWLGSPDHFPCVRVVSQASCIFLLPHGNKEKYGWFTRPHKTSVKMGSGHESNWESPETPMNTKQNLMQCINDVPIIYQASIDFMHYCWWLSCTFVQLNITLPLLKS